MPAVVFYDGACGLCDRTVQFILKRDRHQVFRFSALQGKTAQALLPPSRIQDLQSLVLSDAEGLHFRSEAVLRIGMRLPGGWGVLARVLRRLVPRLWRDAVYAKVAKNRYRWFGTVDLCRLPSPEERARFLP